MLITKVEGVKVSPPIDIKLLILIIEILNEKLCAKIYFLLFLYRSSHQKLEISRNSLEDTCARVSLLIKL